MSRCQNNGLKPRHVSFGVHAKPKPPPESSQVLLLQTPRDGPRQLVSGNTRTKYNSPASDLLARFGIDSYLGRMVTRVLIVLMLFQPVYVALGMELEDTPIVPVSNDSDSKADVDTATENESAVYDSETPELETETDVVEEEDVSDDDEGSEGGEESADIETDSATETSVGAVVDTDNDTETSITDESENTEEVDGEPESAEQVGDKDESESTETDEVNNSDADDVEEGTENAEDGSEDELLPEGGDTSPGGSSEEGGETEEVDDETLTEDTDEDTLEESELVDELILESGETVSQNIESKYVFGEGDCTVVSDGEFYCVASGPQRHLSVGDPRVYAEKDREGDKEIFYFDGVEVHRITNNSYDDFAPVFDDEKMRIVWQAMLNDRLQIMMHDILTKTTRQVTTSRQNSSNPSIAGDTIVWQEWVDTNWEIMMTEIDGDGQEFEIEQLTDNVVHDMFPAAYDGLVTWQSERGSSWEVVVYDMRTKNKHTLKKSEGTKYENPRFVLLFDSKHDNGDVETVGYDLDTGEMMELGTKANHIPQNPVTPKDETPEALPREATSTPQVKVVRDDDGGTGDDGML